MPRTATKASRNGNARTSVKPYWERLEPTEAMFTNEDESPRVRVRVFDDRADVGQRTPGIVVQVVSLWVNDDGETRNGKTASMTLDDPARLGEIAEFLVEVQAELS